MANYIISKIYIENFKLFDRAFIDFSNSNLVVLDGPNGFGKTSIFDAIELVLTGHISRVSNNNNIDGRESYKDILVSKDPDRDTVIMIEFKSDEDSFTIAKRISCNSVSVGVERNPNNLDTLFKTYKLDEFNTSNHDFLPENEILQSEVDHAFNEDLRTFYNLYYYIEQEDRIRYLKKPEKDRMKVLSILFNTAVEESESKKIKIAKDNVDKIINKVEATIQEKEKEMTNIKQNLLEQQINDVAYETLLKWNQRKKDWDKEELDIKDNTKRNSYINELNNIKSFIKYYEEYKNHQQNREFEYYADKKQTKLLEHVILLGNFLASYEEMEKKYNTQVSYKKYLKTLNTKEVNKFNFEDAANKTCTEINLEDITLRLKQISDYRKSSNEISKLINDLNETREKMVEQFDYAQKENNTLESNLCPLCGHDWTTYINLKEQIDIRTEYFKQFYDESLVKINQLVEGLYKDYANEIHKKINIYLGNSDNLIDEKFFKQLSECIVDKNRIIEFLEWCRKDNIELDNYINKEAKYIENTVELVNKLKEEILKKRIDVSEDFRKIDAQINFNNIFTDIFNDNDDNIKFISDEKIDCKISYIDYFYFNNLKKQIEDIDNEISILNPKKIRLQSISTKLRNAKKVYDSQIKRHRSQIIKQIEIPFLIYSGRIIQDYQGGLGILIRENEELNNIRFISSHKTDHDVLNTLSSGQLSALVLAFTLALNKVYQKSRFNTVLIDDPIQSMDDINMASFVELLRNEFENKQLLISTHESEFSGYIRYKFLKYELKSLPFNVKEKLNIPAMKA